MICTQDPEVDQMSTRSAPKYASQKAYMAKGSQECPVINL
jgi:hypothetical protein